MGVLQIKKEIQSDLIALLMYPLGESDNYYSEISSLPSLFMEYAANFKQTEEFIWCLACFVVQADPY